ncbi:MAG: valine--tRNA ligase [Pseudomonadales bacterium]|nr:valine--tRNA ligase [Pseudomonadales bacterium]
MKKYQPQDIEQAWYQKWEAADYFAPAGDGTPYSIAIPPPNVTGTLHMGHAFQHSLVDSLIRYRRMKGDQTLWQMGTDHAGISTQLLVTEQLAAKGIKPSDLGREKFLDKVWQWKDESGGIISRQLRRLGASLHWPTERFTLDEGLSRAVLEVFVRLHDEGLIYRGKRLVNWDPVLQTSISDLEVISAEEKGHLWHFKYPLADNPEEFMVVATTRPETMLGDVAVAVHPDDQRYKKFVGRNIKLPLTDRTIPVVADFYVDKEFGTGCVKITPAHDFNDYEIGKRNNLPLINIFNEDASLNLQVPKKYHGLDRFAARKQIVEDLSALELVVKIEDHQMVVPRGEKSGMPIEPFLSDQWFVKTEPLAEPAIKAVENGDIEFIPKNFENTYFSWMRDIQDWCISRQQWWGHRIPAWYDAEGNVYVGRNETEVRAKFDLDTNLPLNQDEDVLDTWFSSALWTFSTLGWPDKTTALEKFHSTDVMVTGHDIITFWVSRMIMMSLKFLDEVPFKKVYVTGLVTDAEGQKMSKSKGNGLDPLDIIDGIELDQLIRKRTINMLQPKMAKKIEKATKKEYPNGIAAFGTDALRFTFYSIATRSRTIRFDMNRVEGYRNFCNKLWNAANFVFMNTLEHMPNTTPIMAPEQPSIIDRWITSQLQLTIEKVNQAMETYRYDLASKAIYEFIWDEFCDWYLELSKAILNNADATAEQLNATRFTLINTLEVTLRLAHPFIPFMTEEIWQQIPTAIRTDDETIMTQLYPEQDTSLIDNEANQDTSWIKAVVTAIRNIRGEMDISFGKPIPVLFQGSSDDQKKLEKYQPLLKALVKPERFEWLEAEAEIPVSASNPVGEMLVLVPMQGLIDKAAELIRLSKEIDRKQKDRSRADAKLNNPNFINRAPADVVTKEQQKLSDIEATLEQLEQQKLRVSSI